MKASYINSMGSDKMVVDAARVSFNKLASNYTNEQNDKLITYLATHGHWTPFAHPQVQFHFKAPIFVARQLAKHQIGMVWNEVSRRYVDEAIELYWPDKWRGRADNKKQGSSDTIITEPAFMRVAVDDVVEWYYDLIASGVAPEQARMILPLNMYTEWYWTGSLAAWARVYGLRSKKDTQEETREIINQIDPVMLSLFPTSWKALTR